MPFVESIHRTNDAFMGTGLDYDILYITGESLVQRARNNATEAFLRSRFDHLLFIDADLEFKPEDIEALYNMDAPVVCGAYPFKRMRRLEDHEKYIEVEKILGPLARKLVYPFPSTCWKDGKVIEVDNLDGITEIDYAATGFLMVKREVFEKMRLAFPDRRHMEGLPDGNFNDRKESFAWFDPRVTGGDCPDERTYISEDYSFSRDWRDIGGKILLNPAVQLKHHGIYGFG